MKCVLILLLVFLFSGTVASQSTKLVGTIFDPTGAVIVNAEFKATSNISVSGVTNDIGEFAIDLPPGLYSIEVTASFFLPIRQKEFFVVGSTTGRMSHDFVLFPANYHEPCGYGGANCIPKKSIIKSFEVSHSPKLRNALEAFEKTRKLLNNKTKGSTTEPTKK